MWPELFEPIWESLFLITRALPRGNLTTEQRKNVTDHLRTSISLLPCEGCVHHGLRYFIEHPPHIQTGQDAWIWLVDHRNALNRVANKPELTYEEAEAALNQRTMARFNVKCREQGIICEQKEQKA